jgi:spore coat protein A
MFNLGRTYDTHLRRGGGAARPLRARLMVGVTSLYMLGAGSLMYGPLVAPALAADPPCGQGRTSPRPTFFTDEVRQPLVATPDAPNHYTLTAHMGTHSFHSGWPAVDSLGYSTTKQKMDYLGPTIVTKKGTPVDVKIVNGLPAAGTELFPFGYPNTANTVVLHRHGGLQPALSDGTPDQMVAPGGSRTNHYPNNQAAASLWYHDHAGLTTSFNVYAGLAGFMPNTDFLEPLYNLPTGNFAKAYVLQDKSFNADMTLCYTHLSPEFFGDLPVINGTIAPKQTVQPRRYTFTFINGSDSRFYHMTLAPADAATSGAAPQMTVVGSDSGYVLKPAKVNDLLIAPGERYKVVVDFTGHSGQWVLRNDATTPDPEGDPDVATIPDLMRFDVGTTVTGVDRSSVPAIIVETNNVVPPAVSLLTARLRTIQAGERSPGVPQLGDKADLRDFTDPATETPKLGSTEAWAMQNHGPDSHPIHEHLVELRLVGRWPVVWDPATVATGHPVALSIGAFQPPGAFESGPKDTFVAPRNSITVWVGQYTIGGKSVWHCHILSHEDSSIVEMMRPLVVGSATQTQLPVILTQARLDRLIRQP